LQSGDTGRKGAAGNRKIRKGVAEPLQVRVTAAEYPVVMQRADRQLVCVVGPYCERPRVSVELQDKRTGLQLSAVLVGEERHQKLFVEITAVGMPFDIEPVGKLRLRS